MIWRSFNQYNTGHKEPNNPIVLAINVHNTPPVTLAINKNPFAINEQIDMIKIKLFIVIKLKK